MDVERHDMDYSVYLTVDDINDLMFAGNPDRRDPKAKFADLTAAVNGPLVEELTLSCTTDPDVLGNPRTNDKVFFERGENGPIVRISPHVAVSLLDRSREYWVTRYDGENKIWFRKGESPKPRSEVPARIKK